MQRAQRVAICTACAFAVLAVLVATSWSPLMRLDGEIVARAVDPAREHGGYRDAMKTATWLLDSELVLAYTGLLAIGLVVRGRVGAAVWLAAVVGVGTAVNPALKQAFGRHRPDVADPVETFSGLSFPSGHANSAALICTGMVVVFHAGRRPGGRMLLITVAIVAPALSCWTRLTLGGHYPSDVVGGTLLGLTWAAAWQRALPPLEARVDGSLGSRRKGLSLRDPKGG